MHGKHRSRKPGRWNVQEREYPPQQDRVDGMEKHVGEVVSGRSKPPEVVFDPERGVNQRVVLRRRSRVGPDSQESMKRSEVYVLRYVVIVIPDEAGS